ncbi:eSX-1 secretion system protein [Mycobacterium phage prophiT49-2]|nr:eSX-1 secretion system protein [Mycobacterium phage prophiT49-2]
MSLPPLDEFMAIDPNSYLEHVPGWGAEMRTLASDYAEYRSGVYTPGGTDWWGKTATAAQDKAGEDSKAVASIHDTVEGLVNEVTAAVTYEVVPPLSNGHTLVDNIRQIQGATVNQDYTVTYTPPDGMSDEQAEKNTKTIAAAANELKSSVDSWFSASQGVAEKIHSAESQIADAINLSAVGANGRTAVRRAVAETNPQAFAPNEIQKLLSGDPAATTPAGAGSLTDTLNRLPQTQDQPGVPLKDKLGKPELPIPEQELLKKDKEFGTQAGKGVDKSPEGKNTTPTGTTVGGRFGDQTKIGDGKGPTLAKGETGELGGEVNEWGRKGHAFGGDWELNSKQLEAKAGAEGEVKKDAVSGKQHAGVYLVDNKGNIHWDLGDGGKVEAGIAGRLGAEEYTNGKGVAENGVQIGGGGFVGIGGGQHLDYEGHGLQIKGSVEEWAGAGAGAHLTFAETPDHKWKIGGSWGLAYGLGVKPGFEITVDPKEFGGELSKLWQWVNS